MGKRFVVGNRSERGVIPVSLEDFLPENHLARFIWSVVEFMDLREILDAYRNELGGCPAMDPKGLLGAILYGHATGKASSRELEVACREEFGFRYICGGLEPDHSTIARFRNRHQEHVARIFGQALHLCAISGLVKLGVVALDGTKIEANASLASNRTFETLARELEEQSRELDKAERQGLQRKSPRVFANMEDRLARLQEAKSRLEAEQLAASTAKQAQIEARNLKEQETGKKLRGRKPKAVSEKPEETAKANPVDPESRIMKTRKGYIQGYNAQLVVTEDQIILAHDVVNDENDQAQFEPMMAKAETSVEALNAKGHDLKIEAAAADAGYGKEPNLDAAFEKPYPVVIALQKDYKTRKAVYSKEPGPKGRMPKGLGSKQRMARRLATQAGRAIYKKRSILVEPVNGQLKAKGAGQMLRRGLSKVKADWTLICTAHNLTKLWRHLQP